MPAPCPTSTAGAGRDGRRLNAKREEGPGNADQAGELASLATSDDDGR